MNYTQAQIDRANAVSLEDFLRTQGETLIKSGREYRWKEHDSLTVRGNKWFRHSQSKGGYPIDFVMEFYGKSFPEAVQMLTGENGEGQTEATTAPPTALPGMETLEPFNIIYQTAEDGLGDTVKPRLMEADDTLDYIPTQYIAEFVKRIGYDGIVFKSSLYNDENSVNVVIFNFDKCEAVGSVVYDVTRNDYTCEMEDPVSELRLNFQLQLTPDNN